MKILLSIIIVNFNGMKYLPGCLRSIKEHVDCSHEVIVVDNASTDESRVYLQEQHPDITLVCSRRNLGFTGGNNLGAAHARGALLLLLNNDTLLSSSLAPAFRLFEMNSRLGVLGCRMSYGDGRLQPSIGYEAVPLRLALSWTGVGRGRRAPAIFRRTATEESCYSTYHDGLSWVSGAFLMTRRSLWDALGGLDEQFFMYMEDVDYCRRVRDRGSLVAYTPDVRLIHYEGGGKDWIGKTAMVTTMRSYIHYTMKHYGAAAAWSVRSFLCLVMLMRAVAFFVKRLLFCSSIAGEKAGANLAAAKELFRFG